MTEGESGAVSPLFTGDEREIRDRIHAELLALQSMVGADIAFYKQQQWQICNHALVLDAAIVAVPSLVRTLSMCEVLILIASALAVMCAGIVLIADMAKSLDKGRDRLPALRKHFNVPVSLVAYAAGRSPSEALIGSKEKAGLERFFHFILGAGFVITVWLVLRLA